MKVYRAVDKAGEICIERNGEIVRHAIRVLDLPLWDEYNRLANEAQQLQERISESGGEDADSLAVTRDAIEMAVRQIQLLCPTIERSDLEGIPLEQIKEMLQDAVTAAMGKEESVPADVKKKQRNGSAQSSSSQTEGSRSQPSLVSEP